jgi:hypothetical protein
MRVITYDVVFGKLVSLPWVGFERFRAGRSAGVEPNRELGAAGESQKPRVFPTKSRDANDAEVPSYIWRRICGAILGGFSGGVGAQNANEKLESSRD